MDGYMARLAAGVTNNDPRPLCFLADVRLPPFLISRVGNCLAYAHPPRCSQLVLTHRSVSRARRASTASMTFASRLFTAAARIRPRGMYVHPPQSVLMPRTSLCLGIVVFSQRVRLWRWPWAHTATNLVTTATQRMTRYGCKLQRHRILSI